MRTIPYSAAKSDLFTPWMRDDYFSQDEARATASLAAEFSRLGLLSKAAFARFRLGQDSVCTEKDRIFRLPIL